MLGYALRMRRRVPLCVVVALSCAWACSTFDGADGDDAGTDSGVGPVEASAEGSAVDPDAGLDGAQARCGKCELGGCGGTGCEPLDIGLGLHAELGSWEPNGLATSVDTAFFSGTAPDNTGAIWKVPLPKDASEPRATAVRIHGGKRVSDVSLLGSGLFFIEEGGAGTPVLAALQKSAVVTDASLRTVYSASWVRTNSTHVVAGNPAGVRACDPTVPPNNCIDNVTLSSVTLLGAGQADYCFAGTFQGDKGIHCGFSANGAAHRQIALEDPITALVVRGGAAYWSTGLTLGWIETKASPTSSAIVPIAGVSVIAVDSGDMFYALGEKLYRCDKAKCDSSSSTLLGTAKSAIRYLSAEKDYVYFLYGGTTSTQLARFPR